MQSGKEKYGFLKVPLDNDFAKGIYDLKSVVDRLLGPAAPEPEEDPEPEPEECVDCGKVCHVHECQQCDRLVAAHCDCKNPGSMTWCSSNCRAAFDL